MAFEQRGLDPTRARSVFLRDQGRNVIRDLVGSDPGRDTTIMSLESRMRAVAMAEGVPIKYEHRILDVTEHSDHVAVTVQGPRGGKPRTGKASMLVDASGGRLAATNSGALERVATGPSHVYVTAQYNTPPRYSAVYGAFDRTSSEGMVFFPVSDGKSFVAYYDLPPGKGIGNEAALLARYDTLAGRLQLGKPVSPPQAFDAQQHISRNAAHGHVLKIGDSAGNADPYIGAGVAAALVDAQAAVRALTGKGDPMQLARAAAEDVLTGHRNIGLQAGFMLAIRGVGMRRLPSARFDETLHPDDLGASRVLDGVTRFLTSRRIHEGHP